MDSGQEDERLRRRIQDAYQHGLEDGRDEARSEGGSSRYPLTIAHLVREALLTDGEHHKQWYLAEIGKLLKVDVGDEYEPGIAP